MNIFKKTLDTIKQMVGVDNFLYDGIRYWIHSPKKHLCSVTVKADGDSNRVSNYKDININIPSVVQFGNASYTVTEISALGFQNCPNLMYVTLAHTINRISMDAFRDCNQLTQINLPEGLRAIDEGAFRECENLNDIKLPKHLWRIGAHTFQHCRSLTSINIPASTTEIYPGAFWGCESLESITVDEHNPVFDSRNSCNAIIDTKENSLITG